MGRMGCECEDSQQSEYSPGVVKNDEPIVFVLTDPLTIENGSVKDFSKSQLKEKRLSICRSRYSSPEEIKKQVIDVLIRNDPRRLHHGALWAVCNEIRGICLGSSQVGAFCVIDEGLPEYTSHGVIGFSDADIDLRNNREAARGNLKELFMRRGIRVLSDCPFPSQTTTNEIETQLTTLPRPATDPAVLLRAMRDEE